MKDEYDRERARAGKRERESGSRSRKYTINSLNSHGAFGCASNARAFAQGDHEVPFWLCRPEIFFWHTLRD